MALLGQLRILKKNVAVNWPWSGLENVCSDVILSKNQGVGVLTFPLAWGEDDNCRLGCGAVGPELPEAQETHESQHT